MAPKKMIKTPYFSKIKAFAEGFALLLFVLFGIFGALVLGAVIHEYSHASDFNSIAEDEKICGLVLPNKITSLFSGEIGYYLFSLKDPDKNNKEFQQIAKYTEFKAYSFSIIILLVFVVCFKIVFHSLLSETKKIKNPSRSKRWRFQPSLSIKEISALKSKEQIKIAGDKPNTCKIAYSISPNQKNDAPPWFESSGL